MSVATNVRDIPLQIEIKNSCNCCLPKRQKPHKRLYITKDYKAIEFKEKKTKDPEEARRRCYERVQKLFEELYNEGLISKIYDFRDYGSHLTITDINAINQIIVDLAKERVYAK